MSWPILAAIVETLRALGGYLTDNIFDLLEWRCPRLRGIEFNDPMNGFSPERLALFLERCKSLKSISFGSHVEYLVSKDALASIARRRDIEKLELPKLEHRDGTIEEVFRESEPCVRYLQHLVIYLGSRAVPPLLSTTQELQHLSLTVLNIGIDVFQAFAALQNLNHLGLRFAQDIDLARTDILSLRNLSELRFFALAPFRSYQLSVKSSESTDEDFIALGRGFPELRTLMFCVQNNLSGRAITGLARHCRSLESLKMCDAFDLRAWEDIQAPLLPELTRLDLGGFKCSSEAKTRESRAQDLAELISKHAPKLKSLDGRFKGSLDRDVLKAFNALKTKDTAGRS